jgi:catechol 2,3-dioxygenase-like lactoylglutathione lyase family enzyme
MSLDSGILRYRFKKNNTQVESMEILLNVDVPDLELAIIFYQRAIGLSLSRRLFGNTVAELTGASVRIFLLQKENASKPVLEAISGKALLRDYKRHWTPIHFDFVVSDVNAAVDAALAAGAVLEVAVHPIHGGIKHA